MMFSLDSFGGNNPLGRQLLGFLMHNIPVFILIIALVIAWKYEILGGVRDITAPETSMSLGVGIRLRF